MSRSKWYKLSSTKILEIKGSLVRVCPAITRSDDVIFLDPIDTFFVKKIFTLGPPLPNLKNIKARKKTCLLFQLCDDSYAFISKTRRVTFRSKSKIVKFIGGGFTPVDSYAVDEKKNVYSFKDLALMPISDKMYNSIIKDEKCSLELGDMFFDKKTDSLVDDIAYYKNGNLLGLAVFDSTPAITYDGWRRWENDGVYPQKDIMIVTKKYIKDKYPVLPEGIYAKNLEEGTRIRVTKKEYVWGMEELGKIYDMYGLDDVKIKGYL